MEIAMIGTGNIRLESIVCISCFGHEVISDDEDAAENIGRASTDYTIVLTEWNWFHALKLVRVAASMARSALASLCNIYNRDAALKTGFEAYVGVGH